MTGPQMDWGALASLLGMQAPSAVTASLPPINQSFLTSNTSTPAQDRAKEELATQGITTTQRERAYKGRYSDALYYYVSPYGYSAGNTMDALKAAFHAHVGTDPIPVETPIRTGANPRREDAWRLYLGMPQQNGTFEVSDYKPSNAKSNEVYLKIKDWTHRADLQFGISDPAKMKELVGHVSEAQKKGVRFQAQDAAGVMNTYQLTTGRDSKGPYLAYYDVWDLAVPGAEKGGHPFEIYDRVYYDPKTYQILQDPKAADEQRQRETTKLSAKQEQSFRSWVKQNHISDDDKPESAYDYRGFWKQYGSVPIRFGVDHFPDPYKQHGHPTFSVESQYSTGPDDGGHWDGETFIPAKPKPKPKPKR